jgi:hypothetical protein
MVSRALVAGVPAIATTRQALLQGALFAIGQDTGNALLVTDRSYPTIGVTIPPKDQPVPVARLDRGTASISILAAF